MAHGVVFQLGRAVAAIEAKWVRLDDGSSIDAELVVAGINAQGILTCAAWRASAMLTPGTRSLRTAM
jgi:NADH dehydrogenase FAD-containing subunit